LRPLMDSPQLSDFKAKPESGKLSCAIERKVR
jgi:hypothetical protein